MHIGVLGLQGGVAEHLEMLSRLSDETINPIEVRTPQGLRQCDALIIPGGESTALRILLDAAGLTDPISSRMQQGMPVWGTCAGMILLAQKVLYHQNLSLGGMDITVARNVYGRQQESFVAEFPIPELGGPPFPGVFIRAPGVIRTGDGVQVLARSDDQVVACREQHLLVTSFHPELTDDLRLHRYFVHMCTAACAERAH